MRSATLSIICAAAIVACSTSGSDDPDVAVTTAGSAGASAAPVAEATATTPGSSAGEATTTMSPVVEVADSVGLTTAPTTPPTTSLRPTTSLPAPTSQPPTTTLSAPSTLPPTTSAPTTTEPVPPSTPYLVPLSDPGAAGWGDGHSGYPATDIFAACGAEIVTPVNGELREVRTIDSWDPNVDNPATRGGRSVTIVGDDGVRYYLAHLDEVDPALVVGDRVDAGQRLGTVGLTGRTSACHVHFGISPPCPGKEWSVRRGVIPPKPYLDAWRTGRPENPLVEVLAWVTANPDACDQAMGDPFAADS